MPFETLACPQCGAPLPRQARWRMVDCPRCGSSVTRREDLVQAARFKEAFNRARAAEASGPEILVGGRRFRMYARLGRGQHSEVYLGERVGAHPGRVVLKIAQSSASAGVLEAEWAILRRMRATAGLESGFANQRLPEVEGFGLAEGPNAREKAVLILRHQPGFWGTLADVLPTVPEGLDPRHMVWMWRRALGLLAILHDAGWVHSDLAPEHLLLHPQDHGMLFVGWSRAHQAGTEEAKSGLAFSRDLSQVAWSMRALVCGQGSIERIPATVPGPVAELLEALS